MTLEFEFIDNGKNYLCKADIIPEQIGVATGHPDFWTPNYHVEIDQIDVWLCNRKKVKIRMLSYKEVQKMKTDFLKELCWEQFKLERQERQDSREEQKMDV